LEHIDREPVDRDVLRRREEVHEEDEREQQTEPARRRHQRGEPAGDHQERLHRHDPALSPTRAIDERGPERLPHPRKREQPRESEPGERHAALAQVRRERRHLEAERQALREVERSEEGDLAGARAAHTILLQTFYPRKTTSPTAIVTFGAYEVTHHQG